MKYFQKTIIISLVVSLVSFAGGFCTRPMMVEAHSAEMGMDMIHPSVGTQNCLSFSSDETSHSINVCAIDCITTVPKVTNTKKVDIDHILQISLIDALSVNNLRGPSSVGWDRVDDAFGISPPSPDILSSVFKRE